MSYLLDKKSKKRKQTYIVVVVLISIFLIYFRVGIFRGLSVVSNVIFRPIIVFGGHVRESLSLGPFLKSQKSLITENQNLQLQLNENSARMTNYNSVLDENNKLKEILGRKKENTEMILAGVLVKPNQSPYDTLVIDAGKNDGVLENKRVFALGNVPIGRIAEVFNGSSKVVLYSNSGEKTSVIVGGKDIFMQAVGRGGGNFELILPRYFTITEGTEVDLPGITPYILGTVQTIISDPRDSVQKALLVSPVNIAELKFVEVEK